MTFSQSFSTGEVAGSVSDIPPCCAESHAEGKASARRVERQLDERPSLAALSFAPHRDARHLDLHAASSGSSASGLELRPARCTRQGLCTPRRAAARRAACCAEDKQEALRQGLRTPRRAATRRAASSFAPPGLEARPPHAASSGNSASGLELRPARLRGKASARRVERQLGERPRASPRPASRQGLRTPLQAAARRAASSFPPTGLETRTLHDEPSGSSASGLEIHPARLRDKTAARHVERQLGERHRASPRPASSRGCKASARRVERSSATASSFPPPGSRQGLCSGGPCLACRSRRPASSFPPPGIEARPLHAASSGSSASSLELSSALLRGKASARRVERSSASGLEHLPAGIEARPLHAASSDSSASSLELRPPSFGDAQYPDVATLQRQAITAPIARPLNMLPQSSPREGEDGVLHDEGDVIGSPTPPYGPLRPFHAFRLPPGRPL
eukprot:tig00020912_g15875.t1